MKKRILYLMSVISFIAFPVFAQEKVLDEDFSDMFTNEKTYSTEIDKSEWKNGWVAQSYLATLGTDLLEPEGRYIDRWLDRGNVLFSTDYLYAFEGERTYLFNAGILRTGAVYIDKPGNYRFNLYVDRYYSSGTPRCDVRFALDGTTIIDAQSQFETIQPKFLEKGEVLYAQAYKEFALTKSPVFEVVEPGFYRMDFWSFCRDIDDTMQVYKVSNELGNAKIEKSIFGSFVSRVKLFYGGDNLTVEAVQSREKISPLKTLIADNHGTMFDIVLENVDSGRKGRVKGENIWHKREFSPENDILRPQMSPVNILADDKWVFRGVRGRNDFVYLQETHSDAVWAQAYQNMPFVPEYMEARKKISLTESGVHTIALGFDPQAQQAQLGANFAESYVAGQKFNILSLNLEPNKPVSEYSQIYLEKMMSDGSIRRLKLFEGELYGSRGVGELKFIDINLPEGDYEIVILRDTKAYEMAVDRYGAMSTDVFFKSNSYVSFRIKQPSDDGFQLVN